ncbi:O-acetyltransferase OatA [Corynebacterium kutscheri]|uniref:acyltransferase family protein n=1 Tax=Corynebacterium kutscheri TaxID=35755 RepID=UPI000F6BC859|nr:acyltransferase family protein [Corynebacterium kutscheri]VEH81999.1 O-acetyltransferase OatA [Corynebacterium kutscheri]
MNVTSVARGDCHQMPAHGQPNKRIRRVAEIDGMRGLAVLSVVIYHFWPQIAPGGFLGVDVFFVLSGFLITSLLIRERVATGGIGLKNFWVRRARRILPVAVTVLLVGTCLTAAIGGDMAVGLKLQFFSTLLFVNNWAQIASSHSYFADTDVQIFAHYWSLSVEEQFYVFWPLIVVAICLFAHRLWPQTLLIFAVVAAVLSAVAMAVLYVPETDPTRVYYGTDTHAFGLLIGAALALTITSRDPYARDSFPITTSLRYLSIPFGIVVLTGLLAAFFLIEDTSAVAYRGGIVVSSLLTAVTLYCVLCEVGPLNWLFRMPVMRWLGDHSFSLYLWHWPVIVFIRSLLSGVHPLVQGILATIISLALSMLSYRYIENPFRRQGYQKMAQKPVVWLIFLALLSGSLIGLRHVPAQTQLEADLTALRERFNMGMPELIKSHGQETSAESSPSVEPTPTVEPRVFPVGEEITALGDSVMLASIAALHERFPGIYVNAEVSRQYATAVELLQELSAQNALRQFVVLGFGTNGHASAEQIEEIFRIIGPDRTVILVLPYGDRPWIPQARQELIDAATQHPNVYLAPWCAAAGMQPFLLREDAIHPSDEGTVAYAESVAMAIQQWVENEKAMVPICI